MAVWMARTPAAANPLPAPTLAYRAKKSASFPGDFAALSDQIEPATSADNGDPRWHWWPKKGTHQWVEYEFDRPTWVAGVEVYWFDDTGRGECRVPQRWELLVKEDGKWHPAERASGYGTALHAFNRCTFEPVETDGLRLEIQSQEKWAGGIYEWRVIEASEREIREARARDKREERHEKEEERREKEEERKEHHPEHEKPHERP
ncbi:MAG: discoidin domain-containing protein [Fimbriimonas ginsengisoli]|nr:discoidin domain-containing protein [Fimbriimonas ginsengisoli]